MRYSGYSIWDLVWLAYCRCITPIDIPKARMIRRPFYYRKVGILVGAQGLVTGVGNRVDIFHVAYMEIGDNVQINDYCHIGCAENIWIGDDTLIASHVFISDHDHAVASVGSIPNSGGLVVKPVRIGNRVWIGEGVCVLKGVTIEDDVIIGANSVVTKDLPRGCIAVGNPAKVIRFRF
jgi:lipopolysaccharide O-acetyltransferase